MFDRLIFGAQIYRADGVALAFQMRQMSLDAASVAWDGDSFVGELLS